MENFVTHVSTAEGFCQMNDGEYWCIGRKFSGRCSGGRYRYNMSEWNDSRNIPCSNWG